MTTKGRVGRAGGRRKEGPGPVRRGEGANSDGREREAERRERRREGGAGRGHGTRREVGDEKKGREVLGGRVGASEKGR